jgi:hypothetical protein
MYKKKMVIIIFLKLNSGVDLGQDSDYGSGWSTQVDQKSFFLKKNQSNLVLTKHNLKKNQQVLDLCFIVV